MKPHEIVVSAVVIRDAEGRLLTLRRHGVDEFTLPRGEAAPHTPGEDPRATALREGRAQLGADVDADRLDFLGTFTAAARGSLHREISATVFEHPYLEVAASCTSRRPLPAGDQLCHTTAAPPHPVGCGVHGRPRWQ